MKKSIELKLLKKRKNLSNEFFSIYTQNILSLLRFFKANEGFTIII